MAKLVLAVDVPPNSQDPDEGSRTGPLERGADAAKRLRRALSAHGLTIPSLRGGYPVREVAMVELGGCRADVANAIAAVLEKAAEA